MGRREGRGREGRVSKERELGVRGLNWGSGERWWEWRKEAETGAEAEGGVFDFCI